MTESLRQESSIAIDRPLTLIRNRVLAVLVEQKLSATLWTPPEDRPVFADVITVTWGDALDIFPGDRVLIPAHIGVKVRYYGKPGIICQCGEVSAVIE